MNYDFLSVEKKWQQKWEEEKVFSDVLQELSQKELINYEKENVDNE